MTTKLELYYPVFPFSINQNFGDNTPCVKDYLTGNPQYVMENDDGTCPLGFQKLYPILGLKGHNGTDLFAGEQNCYAACEGVVTDVSYDPHRGLGVYVLTDQEYDIGLDKPYRLDVVYWHFKEDLVKVMDRVEVGHLLGVTDSTGASTGNHLHFEIIPVAITHSGSVPAFPNNGYAGAIDPVPFLNGRYANPMQNPKFSFQKDLHYGMWNSDVYAWQKMLRYENIFNHIPTGFYGEITRQCTYDWQVMHKVAPLEEVIRLKGMNVGPASRAYANTYYS